MEHHSILPPSFSLSAFLVTNNNNNETIVVRTLKSHFLRTRLTAQFAKSLHNQRLDKLPTRFY